MTLCCTVTLSHPPQVAHSSRTLPQQKYPSPKAPHRRQQAQPNEVSLPNGTERARGMCQDKATSTSIGISQFHQLSSLEQCHKCSIGGGSGGGVVVVFHNRHDDTTSQTPLIHHKQIVDIFFFLHHWSTIIFLWWFISLLYYIIIEMFQTMKANL